MNSVETLLITDARASTLATVHCVSAARSTGRTTARLAVDTGSIPVLQTKVTYIDMPEGPLWRSSLVTCSQGEVRDQQSLQNRTAGQFNSGSPCHRQPELQRGAITDRFTSCI